MGFSKLAWEAEIAHVRCPLNRQTTMGMSRSMVDSSPLPETCAYKYASRHRIGLIRALNDTDSAIALRYKANRDHGFGDETGEIVANQLI
jgi:hypothetical protein